MHSNSYTIFFTSIVTVVLGGFLSVAAGTLKETQELNVKNDSKKHILASVGFKPEGESKWSPDEKIQAYNGSAFPLPTPPRYCSALNSWFR